MDNGMQTKAWGPPTWAFLYLAAKGYPHTLNKSNDHQHRKKGMKHLLKSLINTLPCNLCRKSYKEFICNKRKHPTTYIKDHKHFKSRRNLMKLIYNIHNKVNDKLCVPKCKRPAFKDVDDFYEQFL